MNFCKSVGNLPGYLQVSDHAIYYCGSAFITASDWLRAQDYNTVLAVAMGSYSSKCTPACVDCGQPVTIYTANIESESTSVQACTRAPFKPRPGDMYRCKK